MLEKSAARVVVALGRAVLRYWPRDRGRLFLWHKFDWIARRFRCELQVSTEWGGKFECRLQDLIQSRIIYFGVWEPHITRFIKRRLSRGDVFVDVGANIGYYSVLAAGCVGSEGSVVAIEASASICEKLLQHKSLNRASNVRVVNAAAGDRENTCAVFEGSHGNLGTTGIIAAENRKVTEYIKIYPLMALLETNELEQIRLIKIDVEGSEWPILANLLENLHKLHSDLEIIVETSQLSLQRFGRSMAELIHEFEKQGFSWHTLHNEYSLQSYLDKTEWMPARGRIIPTDQVDLLFSRTYAATRS